jgi:RIO-like serine/threonine protein kinase
MVFLLSLCIIIFINAYVMQIDDDEKITVIDFPQMVSVSHRNAQMYVSYSDNKRDCVVYFFKWILHLQVF